MSYQGQECWICIYSRAGVWNVSVQGQEYGT